MVVDSNVPQGNITPGSAIADARARIADLEAEASRIAGETAVASATLEQAPAQDVQQPLSRLGDRELAQRVRDRERAHRAVVVGRERLAEVDRLISEQRTIVDQLEASRIPDLDQAVDGTGGYLEELSDLIPAEQAVLAQLEAAVIDRRTAIALGDVAGDVREAEAKAARQRDRIRELQTERDDQERVLVTLQDRRRTAVAERQATRRAAILEDWGRLHAELLEHARAVRTIGLQLAHTWDAEHPPTVRDVVIREYQLDNLLHLAEGMALRPGSR